MDTKDHINYQAALEALLFVSHEPLSLEQISALLECEASSAEKWLLEIEREFDARQGGFKLHRINGGYTWLSDERWSQFVEKLPGVVQVEKLSLAACEVLALLCQRGSSTRAEIERVRGVDSSGVISSLVDKQLIVSSLRAQAPGQPHAYSVSDQFHLQFGMNERRDLEKLYQHRFAVEPKGVAQDKLLFREKRASETSQKNPQK